MSDRLRDARTFAKYAVVRACLAVEKQCPCCGCGMVSGKQYPSCVDKDRHGKRLPHKVWCAEGTYSDDVCRVCAALMIHDDDMKKRYHTPVAAALHMARASCMQIGCKDGCGCTCCELTNDLARLEKELSR